MKKNKQKQVKKYILKKKQTKTYTDSHNQSTFREVDVIATERTYFPKTRG